MANLSAAVPTRKVAAGALAGAVITVMVWLLKVIWNVQVPADVTTALSTVLTFAMSYITPSADRDLVAAASTTPAAVA